jgi:hypothetical protein
MAMEMYAPARWSMTSQVYSMRKNMVRTIMRPQMYIMSHWRAGAGVASHPIAPTAGAPGAPVSRFMRARMRSSAPISTAKMPSMSSVCGGETIFTSRP